MTKVLYALLLFSASLAPSCASKSSSTSVARNTAATTLSDPYIGLENSNDPQVMDWVKNHNAKSVKALNGDSRFQTMAAEIRQIASSTDRIAYPVLHGKTVRNFWQDQSHQRGLIRTTSLEDYQTANPHWETMLDIDELNRKENKSWVYKDMICLPPQYDDCLLSLSPGGRDQVVIREFKISAKAFIKDGFEVPTEGQTQVTWIDKNHIFIGGDFGPSSLTDSGYARDVRIWTRGTPLNSAKVIFTGEKSDVSVNAWRVFRPESKSTYITESLTFYNNKTFLYEHGKTQLLPIPASADLQGEFFGQLIFRLRNDWKISGRSFPAGALVSMSLASVKSHASSPQVEVVYAPDSASTLSTMSFSKEAMVLNVLDNIRSRFLAVKRQNGHWVTHAMVFPEGGAAEVEDISDYDTHLFASYQSFNVPTSLYYTNNVLTQDSSKVKSLPDRFDASDIVVEQYKVASKDGTLVPYFLVHKKSMTLSGDNPTLLYGYGGFEDSQTPRYSGSLGKEWLSHGGVFALANIRGGGEFGPSWHEQAILGNRQKAYDDFAAISKDLIDRRITSPRRLGIQGGSNGGLLVGVALTEHPEYYNAVVCESALLDMIRYAQLPPGASWIGEYGDPSDPKVADYILKYSPYQNVRANMTYPEPFFHVSTADDRVQPGHSRKMVAKMEEQGHPVLIYENTEGGHGGAADPEQTVQMLTQEYIYLYQKLMD